MKHKIKHLEIEDGERAISIPVEKLRLLRQRNKHNWLAAFAQEVEAGNTAIISYLKRNGIVSDKLNRWGVIREMRSLSGDEVLTLRNAFLEEADYVGITSR